MSRLDWFLLSQGSTGQNQGVNRDLFLSRGLGNKSASKPIHNVCRIQLHAATGVRSQFPCCFGGWEEGSRSQLLETAHIPRLSALDLHLQRSSPSHPSKLSDIPSSALLLRCIIFCHISLTLLLSSLLCFPPPFLTYKKLYIIKLYNLMSLDIVYTHENRTTVYAINLSITSKNFPTPCFPPLPLQAHVIRWDPPKQLGIISLF